MEVSDWPDLGHFTPRVRASDMHRIGVWVGCGICWDVLEKAKVSCLCWDLITIVQPVA
jgi:hypothetical protein